MAKRRTKRVEDGGDSVSTDASAPKAARASSKEPAAQEHEGQAEEQELADAGNAADANSEVNDAAASAAQSAEEDSDGDDAEGSELHAPVGEMPAPESTIALSRRDPFQAYIREVQRYPLLTREQERELTQQYEKTGDPDVARRLVTANLRLVVKLAYEYRRAYKNMMDLIQEGNIGLMQAVKRYDPYRGVKLSSYSAWWIRAYMLRYILNNWRLVKLGTTQAQRKLFFNLNKQKAKLNAMGIDPTPALIADRLGVKEREVIEMDRRMSSAEASLDAPLGDAEGRSVPRVEVMPSDDKGTDEYVASLELHELLSHHLGIFRQRLGGKDLVIFDKRMIAEDPLTLQALGKEFGVSRERVRQLQARLSGKLRDYLKAELGDAVDLGV